MTPRCCAFHGVPWPLLGCHWIPHQVYTTPERVIGLVRVPLDGNPVKTMGLLAHPMEISAAYLAIE